MSNRTAIALIAIIVPFAVWANISLYQKFTQPTVIYQTEVRERIITQDVITTLDLEDLKQQLAELDEQLYLECVEVIVRHTGDPRAGVIRHIERHYQGEACRAADEALSGNW